MLLTTLQESGIQPSAQRLAIARYVLTTADHPSAEQVFHKVKQELPTVSRATVYNTLNLFVKKGLLRQLTLAERHVVFDPKLTRHHHFVDVETGRISDVPWEALKVAEVRKLTDFEIEDYQVVLRGRRRSRRQRS